MLKVLLIGFMWGVAAEESISTYSNPVGTSYNVPLTKSYTAPQPANSVSYSVSADDLARSDSSVDKYKSEPSQPVSGYSKQSSSKLPVSSSSGSKLPSSNKQQYRAASPVTKQQPQAAAESRVSPVFPAAVVAEPAARQNTVLTSSSSAPNPSNPSNPSVSKTLSSSHSTASSSGSAGAVNAAAQPAGTAGTSGAAGTTVDQNSVKPGETPAAERSDVSSSYQVPSVGETYAAPVSTGNLYYYYYPVQEEPIIVERNDTDEMSDPLVIILLPIIVIVGGLALISIISAISLSGRAFGSRGFSSPSPLDSKFGSFSDLQKHVDSLLYQYYNVLESDGCMDRIVCELGTRAKDLSGKDYLLTALDWIIPSSLAKKIDTFKLAVHEGYDSHHCKKYRCDSKTLIDISRRRK